MARIRSVKPELRDSLVVASWPFEVRYFWVLFWGYLDDSGRGNDMPKRIAGDCFPHDDIDGAQVDEWLDLMTHKADGEPGPVCRYEVAGRRYLHAVNWREHQKPNRPTKSRIPLCPVHEGLSESLSESLDEDAVPGAAEQQSRGAGEQRQLRRESLTAVPAGADQATRLVIDATGVEAYLAAEAVLAINAERKPRNLPGLVRTLAEAGELDSWIAKARTAVEAESVQATIAAARASPLCPHDEPGGEVLHPVTRQPLCPLCRKGVPA
jgi:hypothetical protein